MAAVSIPPGLGPELGPELIPPGLGPELIPPGLGPELAPELAPELRSGAALELTRAAIGEVEQGVKFDNHH